MTSPVIAAIDLLTVSERHGDELASTYAAQLTRLGGRDVLVATHSAVLDEHQHLALTVEVTGLEVAAVAATLWEHLQGASEATRGLLADKTFFGLPGLQPVLQEVLDLHRARSSGRVVVFPGGTTLTGTLSVARIVASTRIDRVRVIGSAEPPAGSTPLITRGFVRPRWTGGELVLHVQPAVGGALVPFETPDPTPCCAAHS